MNCAYCGAPLDVTPDSVVVICRYCGRPNFLVGNPQEVLAVPTLSNSEVISNAVKRTQRDLNLRWRIRDINFASPELYYLPFYFVKARLSATYSATVLVTYTRARRVGNRTVLEPVTKIVNVSGRVALSDVVAVLARKAAWGLSVDSLTKHFFETAPEPRPLTEVVTSGSYLAAEFGPERAKAKAVRSLIPALLAKVDADAQERAIEAVGVPTATAAVQDKSVDYAVEELEASRLTYLPLWRVPYLYKGSYYNYYVAGWDGAVILAEEPSFVENKAGAIAATMAIGGLIGGFGASALTADIIIGSVALLAASALTYYTAGPILKSRRVEK